MAKAGVEVVDYLYLLGSGFLFRINLSKFMETGIPPPVELVVVGDDDERDRLCKANGTRYFDVDYKLHCVGGERYDKEEHTRCCSDRVFTFDPHTHNPVLATNIPPLNAPKCIPQTATVDGKIYVLSGSPFVCHDQSPPGPVFEVFDPSLNAWEDLPTLPDTVYGHLLHSFFVWEREIVICTDMGPWSFDTVARSWRQGSSFRCWPSVCLSPWRGSFVALRNKYFFSLSLEQGLVAFDHSNPECCHVMHDFNALFPLKSNSFSGVSIHPIGSAGEAEERLCAVFTNPGKAMVCIFRVIIDQAGESCRVIVDYTHTFECEVLRRVHRPCTFISHQRQNSQKVENGEFDVSSEMSKNVLSTIEVGILLSSPLAIPERLGTDKNIEIQKMEKLIKALESARGNGASMISLILPTRDQISVLIKMLEDEYGTVSNITGRDSHQLGAITSAQQRLKLYDNVPPNGLVLHIATIVTEGGEEKVTFDFEPFMPVNASLFVCDKKFRAEALNRILEYDRFGFIVMGKNGALFGTLGGNTREVVHHFYVKIPPGPGRYGPQSKLLFAYKRRVKIQNLVRKTAEVATDFYINPTTCLPNVSGLILAGKSHFHTQLSQSDMFDSRLKAKILNVVDVSCEGESGFIQAIELSSEIIPHVKFIQEKRVMNVYFWG